MNTVVIFPILLSLLIPILILVCYVQGNYFGHFEPILPLVSDTGNYPQHAGVFAIVMVTIGILFWIVVIIRHLQLKSTIQSENLPFLLDREPSAIENESLDDLYRKPQIVRDRLRLFSVDRMSFLIGMLVGFNFIVTGSLRTSSVQTTTTVFHSFFATGILFGVGLYMTFQAYISSLLIPVVSSVAIYRVRLFATLVNLLSVVIILVALPVSLLQLGSSPDYDPLNPLFPRSDQPGFSAFLIFALSEWLFLLSISPFALSFWADFQQISFHKFKIEFKLQLLKE